jgi:putative peptidoglycan lipid II flippase
MLETAKISTYTLIVKICFSIILIQPFGVAGLALSTTLSSLCYLFLQFYQLKNYKYQDFR